VNTKSCPCNGCITYAVCRHKRYYDLLNDCSIVKKYLDFENYTVHKKRCVKLLTTLKPTEWVLGQEHNKGFDIIYFKELANDGSKSSDLPKGDEYGSSL